MFKVNNNNDAIYVVLVSLFLTLDLFHTFFQSFYCWLWTSKELLLFLSYPVGIQFKLNARKTFLWSPGRMYLQFVTRFRSISLFWYSCGSKCFCCSSFQKRNSLFATCTSFIVGVLIAFLAESDWLMRSTISHWWLWVSCNTNFKNIFEEERVFYNKTN